MIGRAIFLILSLFPFFLSGSNWLGEKASDRDKFTELSRIKARTTVLSNGMKVILKPTPFDEGEVFIQVVAMGGFAALPEKQQPAARIAADLVLKSGIGFQNSDQLAIELFENGIEFDLEIEHSSRVIELSGREDRMEPMFRLIHDVFEESEIDPATFDGTKATLIEDLKRKKCSSKCRFEIAYKMTNSGDYPPFKLLTSSQVTEVGFDDANAVYNNAFRDPSEFVFVMVGDFDSGEAIPLIQKYLATIPRGVGNGKWNGASAPEFPKAVASKSVEKANFTESLTRITFPLSLPVTEENFSTLRLSAEVIEARLRDILKKNFGSTHGVDASIQLPLLPSVDAAWFTIQFRSDPDLTPQIIRAMIQEVNAIHRKGVDASNIDEARKLLAQSQQFSWNDNDFWVNTIAEYALLDWNPDNILNHSPSNEQVEQAVKTFFSPDNHTIVTGGF